jgi:hypothetical protein
MPDQTLEKMSAHPLLNFATHIQILIQYLCAGPTLGRRESKMNAVER